MDDVIISVDFGGTKIRAVIADRSLALFDERTIPTPLKAEDVVEELTKLIHHMHGSLQQTVVGVGISMPGFVTPSGTIASCPNIIGMDGFPFRDELMKRLALPVVIENDANCFALAEWTHGAGKGTRSMIGVIVGSGFGFGMILDGKLYRGAIGGAGEFNHSFSSVSMDGRLRDYCSGKTIEQRYLERTNTHKGCKEIFEMHDPASREVVRLCHQHLGLAFSYVVNLLNPELIVLGGGVSNSLDVAKIQEYTETYCYDAFRGTFKVVKNALGSSSGIYGAAELAFRHLPFIDK